jgi:hypothetical protein
MRGGLFSALLGDETCPVSTGGGTRLVRLVRGRGGGCLAAERVRGVVTAFDVCAGRHATAVRETTILIWQLPPKTLGGKGSRKQAT